MGVNSFIIDGDEGVVLVDTGLPRRHGKIIEQLKSIGRSVDEIQAILVTHAHTDHTGGLAALAGDAAVVASAVDAPAIAGRAPAPVPPVLDRGLLRWMAGLVPAADPVEPSHLVESGPVPVTGDVVAIPTPGHTPGHTSYLLDRGGGMLFAGDSSMASRSGRVHRGYMNRKSSTFDASLRSTAEHDFAVACFGHSGAITVDAAGAFRAFVASLD